MSEEAVKWLREQVTQRMETAGGACHSGEGNWWRRLQVLYADGEPVPAGALFEGTPEVDDPEHDIFLADVVVYDEGHPSDQQFVHIALNDPQDVIARCEAELAILDLHQTTYGPGHPCKEWLFPCKSVRLLASGYKYREGYAGHWGEVNQPAEPGVSPP